MARFCDRQGNMTVSEPKGALLLDAVRKQLDLRWTGEEIRNLVIYTEVVHFTSSSVVIGAAPTAF